MSMRGELSFTVTQQKRYDEAFVVIGSESEAAWKKLKDLLALILKRATIIKPGEGEQLCD